MGLFNNKVRQEAVEQELLEKLSSNPLLDLIVDDILNDEEESWMRFAQSYYDNCLRTVSIQPDLLEIKWRNLQDLPTIGSDGEYYVEQVDDGEVQRCYSYTKSGYVPLHRYSYDDGKRDISIQRICYLWACVVRNHMAKRMPYCNFGEVNTKASFTYTVPFLSFKDWFK